MVDGKGVKGTDLNTLLLLHQFLTKYTEATEPRIFHEVTEIFPGDTIVSEFIVGLKRD